MSHVYADPEILEGVRAEVAALLARKGCGIRELNLDDLLGLKLTNACITEAVRLHSASDSLESTLAARWSWPLTRGDIPSKLTLRSAGLCFLFTCDACEAEIPMEFGGYQIPQGATIFLYADAVHKELACLRCLRAARG